MGLTSSIDIDLSEYPTGIAPEQFVGSLTRDTAFGAGDFVAESVEETLNLNQTVPILAQTGFILQDGWSLISWPWPYEQDMEEAFNSLTQKLFGRDLDFDSENMLDQELGDIAIVKDNSGKAFWPAAQFNGIGNFKPMEGYQIKIPSNSPLKDILLEFPLKESEVKNYPDRGVLKNTLDVITRDLNAGWNMFGTGRLEPIDAVAAFQTMSYFGFPISFNHENQLPGVITTLPRSNQIMSTVSLTNNFEPGDAIQIEYTAGGGDIPQAGLTSTFKENTTIHAFVNEFTASITPIDYGDTINPENVRGSVLTNPLISTLPSISIEWSGSNRVVITGTNTLFTRDFIVATDPSLNYLHTPGSRLFYDAFSKTFSVPILNVISDTQLIAFANNGINYYKHLGNDNQEYVELAGTIDYRPIYSENAEWNENVNPASVPRFQEQMLIQITGSGTSFLSDFIPGNRVLLELEEFVNASGLETPHHFRNKQIHSIYSDTSMSIYKGTALTHTLNTNDILGTVSQDTSFDFPNHHLYHDVPSSNENAMALNYKLVGGLELPFSQRQAEIICTSGNSLFTEQFVIGDTLLLDGNNFIGSKKVLITHIYSDSRMQVSRLTEAGTYPDILTQSDFLNGFGSVTLFTSTFSTAFDRPALVDLGNSGAWQFFAVVEPGTFLQLSGGSIAANTANPANLDLVVLVTEVIFDQGQSINKIFIAAAPGQEAEFNALFGFTNFVAGINWKYATIVSELPVHTIQSRRFTMHAYNKALPVTSNAHYNGKLQSNAYYKETIYENENITDSVQIVKDYLGRIYWPQFGYNSIGNLNPGEGYQLKMNNNIISGKFAPHDEENRPLIDQ